MKLFLSDKTTKLTAFYLGFEYLLDLLNVSWVESTICYPLAIAA